ncbi:sulfite exporter TauE/SafE family protein [Candidatus Peregrinibacteria bacterium]|nr:sulfite exporter TauE/SafE family protein [Candidatus Peregrinibacteria bacterium]
MEILFIVILGFLMGLITSISGGAGVFAVPTMLAFGVPPVGALALNRISDVGVVLGAISNFWKAKTIDWKLGMKIIPFLAAGSFVGANIVVNLEEKSLRTFIVIGVVIGMLFLFKPARPFVTEKGAGGRKKMFGFLLMLVVGVWSGALAMAGATFALLVLVYCFGNKYVEARSTEIFAAIPETLISAFILVSAATVDYLWLIAMFVSSFAGAVLGSHLAVKKGDGLVKKGIVLIGILMIAKIIFQF